MASRRQKFKPLAGIQKARRVQNTLSESTKKLNESELHEDISIKIEDSKTEPQALPEECKIESTVNDVELKSGDNSEKAEKKPQVNTAPRPLRRSIKPAVVIPDRKRKTIQPNEVKAEENCDKPPVSEIAVDKSPRKSIAPVSPLTPLKLKQENSDNIQKPLSSDDTFKSPFLSPSTTNTKRPEFLYNPLDQQNSESDDPTKSPAHSAKVRQRIRPTPYFGRRNSVQGATIESDDESNKRQRHLSTSSNHSNYNFNNNVTPKAGSGENSRIRTESVCSNISEAAFPTFSKPKRIARSEEFQRIANAKKEFNQRFNGKTPDKQHLTMYDMIYYNPITNPLKNPAAKSNDVKDRRSSSAASVHSVQSVASVRSIKSEIKTSDDSLEVEMPVPQLKLGPNGEIVLDEKSLVIETTGDKEARETLAHADIIYDDEFSGSTGFYKRQKRTREWDANETIKFYRCLHSVGTDFSLMLMLFPNRNRRDLKLKFKKEEKTNLNLINKALLHPKEFNIDDLKVELEREEKELERKKLEWEELKQKHAKERREQTRLLKQKNRKSSSRRNIAGGDTIYEHEFATAPRKNRKKGAYITKPDTPTSDSLPSFDYAFSKAPPAANDAISRVKDEYILPHDALHNKNVPASSEDILNMDVVFEDVVQTGEARSSMKHSHIEILTPIQNASKSIGLPENTSHNADDNVMCVDTSHQLNTDSQLYTLEKSKIKVEVDVDENSGTEEVGEEIDREDEDNEDSNSNDDLSMNELAVVASHSIDDPNNVIYEVYAVSPITGELSDKPLDLPADVVERIRKSMDV